MKVICISGKAGSGKDTTASFMKEILTEHDKRVLITHYADLVKYVCTKFFGWDGEKDHRGRALLQRVGTDIVRAHDEDYWVRFLADMLTMFSGEWDFVLIPDARFPNEISVLRDRGFDVSHIRVSAIQNRREMWDDTKAHSSETSMDDADYDHIVYNYGTLDDLFFTAGEILERHYGVVHSA